MFSRTFISSFLSTRRKNSTSNAEQRCSRRAAVEQLEDRQLLAVTTGIISPAPAADQTVYEASALTEDLTIDLAELNNADHVVTTPQDIVDPYDGVLSLREAIAAAQDGDRIVFSQALGDNVVVDVDSELVVSNAIAIDGGGRVALDAGGQNYIMAVTGGTEAQYVQLKGLTFQNALAVELTDQGSLDGAALYVANSAYVNVVDSVFRDNVTQACGGAIASYGHLTVSNTEFYNNQARSGGAVALVDGYLTGENLVFHDNYAENDGGAVQVQYGYAEFDYCKFYSNAAEGKGGAVHTLQSTLTVADSVFFANTAAEGGALYDEYQYNYSSLYNCTIAGNSAKRGGGIYSLAKGVKIYNTIVANNFAFDGENMIGQAYRSSNNWIDKDVMFVEAPQFNGNGALKNFDTLDLRLLGTSAAVDAGKSTLVQNEVDAIGNIRHNGDAVDIGAYEHHGLDPDYEVDVAGRIRIDTTLTASAIADGEQVENVRYYWYVSDTADGELSLIEGADKETYKAPNEFLGKFLTAVAATDTYAAMTTVGPLEKAKLCKRAINTAATSDKIVLSWTEVPRAGSYLVQYRLSGTQEWTSVEVKRAAFELTGLDPDTAYDFRVKALSADNQEYHLNGDYSNLTAKTLPADADVIDLASPKGVLVDSLLPTSAELSWLGCDGAQGYWVYVYDAEHTQLLNTVWTDTNSVVLDALTPLTTYAVDIAASSETLGDSEAAAVKFTTLGKKLVIPSVSASIDLTTAELRWSAVSNAQGYLVSYKGEGDAVYKTLATVDGTSCTIKGLDPDTVYRFRVKAIGGGEFINSDNGTAYALSPVLDSETAYAPEKIVKESATATSLLLSWSEGYNADRYRVVVKDANGEVVKTVRTVLTSLRISELTAETTYNIEIYSVSLYYGESENCATLTTTTDSVRKLTKPVVTTEYLGDGKLKIYWDLLDGAVSYRLQYHRNQPDLQGNNPWLTCEDLELTSGTISGLRPGWTYTFRVRANGDGIDYYNSDNTTITVTIPKWI